MDSSGTPKGLLELTTTVDFRRPNRLVKVAPGALVPERIEANGVLVSGLRFSLVVETEADERVPKVTSVTLTGKPVTAKELRSLAGVWLRLTEEVAARGMATEDESGAITFFAADPSVASRTVRQRVPTTDALLAKVAEKYRAGGIAGVRELGYGRSFAYKLRDRAVDRGFLTTEEVGR